MSINNHRKSRFHRLFYFVSIIVLISTMIAPIPDPVLASTAPQPISPADGMLSTVENYPPLGIPTFLWGTVAEATEYSIQFSKDIGFTIIALNVKTTNTRYTPVAMDTNLFADGDWYWRVRVEKPVASEYSSPLRFQKLWASESNRVTLDSPVSDAVLDFYSAPTFTWQRVLGASAYRFQIATAPDGFATPVYNQTTLNNSHQPANKLANGQYYWRVIPLDGAYHLGKESEVRSFRLLYGTSTVGQVPELYEPTNLSQVLFTPTFRWQAIAGAEKYQLEYMTDDGVCQFGSGTIIETRMTTYTPTSTFTNDNFCWHVRVISGQSSGEWSDTWHFRKQWDIQPVLLTPTNNYKYGLHPLYGWTPVPGAAYYRIEIARDQIWTSLFDSNTTANPFYTPRKYYGTIPNPYAWRVIPYDWNGHAGATSEIFSFQSYYTSTAPSLFFPYYYYIPNDSNVYGDIVLEPHEDRTAQYPVFQWRRVDNPWPYGGTYAPAYRIEVSTSPNFFTIIWTTDTESTHATPTEQNPFDPILGQNYYWRVCPLDSLGGTCGTVTETGDEWWSQVWRARFDKDYGTPPSIGSAPELLRPAHGDEWVEATPLLEWRALDGADYYQVQVNTDPSFTEPAVIDQDVAYPVFSSETSLAQRYLNRLDYGTFYWRVRANIAGQWSGWSQVRRFQIASQSEWRFDRVLGALENRLQIGADGPDVVNASYDLTSLYASNSNENWYFGINTTLTPGLNMVYGFYLDIDHIDGSGADSPPGDRAYLVDTIAAHEPEYAIYVDQVNGAVSASNTWLYKYANNAWQDPQRLSELAAGALYYNSGYLELQIAGSAIGMSDFTGSISLIAFTVSSDPLNKQLVDSTPSDPEVPGSGVLSRFASVTEHMNLYHPPNTGGGDPTAYPTIKPFFWDFPTGSDPTGIDEDPPSPWAGSLLEACLDAACTTKVGSVKQVSNAEYFASSFETMLNDIYGDTTYYWRIQPRYLHETEYFGAYNSGYSFLREGFVPVNLQTSVTFATPTFLWDLVEGAGAYDFQLSKGPDFGTGDVVLTINALTQNTYTPTATLAEGEYWWRVRVRRYGNFTGDWSSAGHIILDLPSPTGLTPDENDGDGPVEYAPTLCWDHLVAYSDGVPVLTAWKYRVEVSKDPNFSAIWDTIDTEQNCWTPVKAYDDGTYYWHVSMIDGNNRRGGFSDSAQFTKQYPITTLVSPIGSVNSIPTFQWTPVDGARSYSLQVSLYPTFSPLYETIDTVNIQYTPIKKYDLNRTYYWRVAMRDQEGKFGPYNDAMIIIGNHLSQLPLVVK